MAKSIFIIDVYAFHIEAEDYCLKEHQVKKEIIKF